ncbi:MAG: Rrf2 family transcriptional regulator [Clostridia bacterium]|nr:Rrf2 family transcriptional regulator [Clostridia bacterium]
MKDVAARQQISKKYLEAFTAPLASAGILGIRRGKNGGYRVLGSRMKSRSGES